MNPLTSVAFVTKNVVQNSIDTVKELKNQVPVPITFTDSQTGEVIKQYKLLPFPAADLNTPEGQKLEKKAHAKGYIHVTVYVENENGKDSTKREGFIYIGDAAKKEKTREAALNEFNKMAFQAVTDRSNKQYIRLYKDPKNPDKGTTGFHALEPKYPGDKQAYLDHGYQWVCIEVPAKYKTVDGKKKLVEDKKIISGWVEPGAQSQVYAQYSKPKAPDKNKAVGHKPAVAGNGGGVYRAPVKTDPAKDQTKVAKKDDANPTKVDDTKKKDKKKVGSDEKVDIEGMKPAGDPFVTDPKGERISAREMFDNAESLPMSITVKKGDSEKEIQLGDVLRIYSNRLGTEGPFYGKALPKGYHEVRLGGQYLILTTQQHNIWKKYYTDAGKPITKD